LAIGATGVATCVDFETALDEVEDANFVEVLAVVDEAEVTTAADEDEVATTATDDDLADETTDAEVAATLELDEAEELVTTFVEELVPRSTWSPRVAFMMAFP